MGQGDARPHRAEDCRQEEAGEEGGQEAEGQEGQEGEEAEGQEEEEKEEEEGEEEEEKEEKEEGQEGEGRWRQAREGPAQVEGVDRGGKKLAAAQKSKGVGLFKKCTCSADLAAITGSKSMTRPAAVKAVWVYIKKNGLSKGRTVKAVG